MRCENVPENFVQISDKSLRDKYITEFGELRRHIFAQHAATLEESEQDKLKNGTHPSQSHDYAEEARPYLDRLRIHLQSLGVNPIEMQLGCYHFDRIILSVDLDGTISDDAVNSLPWLFEGFEVFYHKQSPKNAR